MCPQSAWIRGCKVTFVAYVWLFSTVSFHVYFQMVCLRGCKVTLVASVWLFSTLCFQMSPQIACLWECKVTLFAFVWHFSNVCFFKLSSNCVPKKRQNHIGCICLTFLHYVFPNVSSNFLRLRMYSHIDSLLALEWLFHCTFINASSNSFPA